jgi:predicted small lipoprotein YifL
MPDRPPLRSLCLAVLLVIVCLSGCGQKGPLYLPEEDGQENR